MHEVRVEVRRMGGGFGGKKSGQQPCYRLCYCCRATNRPCKMRYDRDDDFIITGKRHDFRIDYSVGFDQRGKIQGISFAHYVRCGWSQIFRCLWLTAQCFILIMLSSGSLSDRKSSLAHKHPKARRPFVDLGTTGYDRYRTGDDHIAHHLSLDPIKVRKRNYYKDAIAKTAQEEYKQRLMVWRLLIASSIL